LFHGVRAAYSFPAKMNGVGGESGGVIPREGLTERVIRKGRDAIPVGRIPADPRGLGPKPGRGGIKRIRPKRSGRSLSVCPYVGEVGIDLLVKSVASDLSF
jgi:hypothetical protein